MITEMVEATTVFNSPIGGLRLSSNGEALTGLSLSTETPLAAEDDADPDNVLREARGQLAAYFDLRLTRFDLPLAPQGTDFQRRVWELLRDIPFGETITYAELATRAGNPKAMRAVGAANGRNPVMIIIPCHRVIGADGSLTGFGGGIERKRWLLEHERRVISD
jgi:methylated-DNA-[protein]-cysteine S-methyltransferase